LVVVLALAVSGLSPQEAWARTDLTGRVRLAMKVKANIANLGVGRDVRISVRLKNGRSLKGWVTDVADDAFVVSWIDAGGATGGMSLRLLTFSGGSVDDCATRWSS
jgi:hypothetical protein